MDELGLIGEVEDQGAELTLAEVTGWSSTAGYRLKFPGQTAGSQKYYKRLSPEAGSALVGKRVVVLKQSGSYVVLGALSDEATYDTSTISQIATAGNGWTITAAHYAQFGKVAMVELHVATTNDVTITTSDPIATMVTGKRPVCHSSAQVWLSTTKVAVVDANGQVRMTAGTISSGSSYAILASYLLP